MTHSERASKIARLVFHGSLPSDLSLKEFIEQELAAAERETVAKYEERLARVEAFLKRNNGCTIDEALRWQAQEADE